MVRQPRPRSTSPGPKIPRLDIASIAVRAAEAAGLEFTEGTREVGGDRIGRDSNLSGFAQNVRRAVSKTDYREDDEGDGQVFYDPLDEDQDQASAGDEDGDRDADGGGGGGKGAKGIYDSDATDNDDSEEDDDDDEDDVVAPNTVPSRAMSVMDLMRRQHAAAAATYEQGSTTETEGDEEEVGFHPTHRQSSTLKPTPSSLDAELWTLHPG